MSSESSPISPLSPPSPISPRSPRSPALKRILTPVGKATLLSETATNRSIFACAVLLDSCVSFETIRHRFNSKLLSFDRFASKVSKDGQYFEVIKGFDCIECMDNITVTGDDINTHLFVEQILSDVANQPFTYRLERPLWRLHVYNFQHVQQTAIVMRCHHCICDGITFGFIFHNLCDANQSQSSSDSKPKKKEETKSLFAIVLHACFWFIGLLIFVYRAFVYMISKKQQTIFKNTLTDKKHIAYISMEKGSLDKINTKRKSIKLKNVKKYATFNDFMLSVIAQSVTLYLQKKNQFIPKAVYVATPVNIRKKNASLTSDKGMLLGNKIGTYVLKIPLATNMTFIDRLTAIKSELDAAKSTPEAIISYNAMKLLSKMPRIGNIIAPRMTEGVTFVVSNVRGADNQAFCGAKINDIVGFVPPPMGVALGYAVFTYDGKVMVSVNVDRNCYDRNTATELIACLKDILKQEGCYSDTIQ